MNEMDEPVDDVFESALRAHLKAELDGRLGQTEARFRRAIAAGMPRPTRRAPWWGLAAGLVAAAASVAIVWATAGNRGAKPTREVTVKYPTTADAPVASMPQPTEQVVQYTTVDEGTVVLENEGPARRLRRTVLETYQYYDAERHGLIEITVPREQTVLVAMQTF